MFRMLLFLAGALIGSSLYAQVPADDDPNRWNFPQLRQSGDYKIVVHAPQIHEWPDFKHFRATAVVEVTHPDDVTMDIGAISIEGDTEVDLQARLVKSSVPKITALHFPSTPSPETQQALRDIASKKELSIPLDLFLAQLADSILEKAPPEGFNFEPPHIHVASKPTVLLMSGGEPMFESVENSPVERLINSNWPIAKAPSDKRYFMLYNGMWLVADALDGSWTKADALPKEFDALAKTTGIKNVKTVVPLRPSKEDAPTVIFTKEPAELIVIDGVAKLEEIPGTGGLRYVSNTVSPLFKLKDTWFFLVAGRWFSTSIMRGPWSFEQKLPEAFSNIPDDHAMAAVRSSVRGTQEARVAALEASLPTRKSVAKDSVAPIEIGYAGGAPEFQSIPETQLKRAVNSSYDIIQHGDKYYLCYQGVWYEASAQTGPWVVATSVPESIYKIPPSSPAYHVTYVTIEDDDDDQVHYSYLPAYVTGMYVAWGATYCGTGWYYPPWAYSGFYYPYYGSYGHGSWYNPRFGGYGSRSLYYGPYGGYTYNTVYNPNTGRRGYVETGWDHNDWASYSEFYNPRTGIYTETSRHLDDDGRLEMERTRERGNQEIETVRKTDLEEGRSYTRRETERGGEMEVARTAKDGTLTTSGTIETADGRSATVQGKHTSQGGSTTITGSSGDSATVSRDRTRNGANRDATVTRDGQTVSTSTRREGNRSATDFSTSGGATGKSVAGGAV
ncbi:MAG: hypothetical protein ACPHUF_11070, partial [Gammaproteobacteria bacterium]